MKNPKVAITHLAIEIDTQVTDHVVAMKKIAEYHILTKCSKCNTFQVIIDLMHDFINFNALKIILKIHKKTLACESSPKSRRISYLRKLLTAILLRDNSHLLILSR